MPDDLLLDDDFFVAFFPQTHESSIKNSWTSSYSGIIGGIVVMEVEGRESFWGSCSWFRSNIGAYLWLIILMKALLT